ncbi:hypothetical protein C8R43DRAFT_953077 [Mycena crocata]|nr:hypothetical protein C8R43DRAFT_953077 [Mycena crocata]
MNCMKSFVRDEAVLTGSFSTEFPWDCSKLHVAHLVEKLLVEKLRLLRTACLHKSLCKIGGAAVAQTLHPIARNLKIKTSSSARSAVQPRRTCLISTPSVTFSIKLWARDATDSTAYIYELSRKSDWLRASTERPSGILVMLHYITKKHQCEVAGSIHEKASRLKVIDVKRNEYKSLLEKSPSVIDLVVRLAFPATDHDVADTNVYEVASDVVNSFIAHLTVIGSTPTSPQLSGLYVRCLVGKVQERALKHITLLTHTEGPNISMLVGLENLRQDGLDLVLAHGKSALDHETDLREFPDMLDFSRQQTEGNNHGSNEIILRPSTIELGEIAKCGGGKRSRNVGTMLPNESGNPISFLPL